MQSRINNEVGVHCCTVYTNVGARTNNKIFNVFMGVHRCWSIYGLSIDQRSEKECKVEHTDDIID